MLPKEHLTQAALLSCLTLAACGSRLCCNHTLFLSLVLQNGKTTSMPPRAVLKKTWNVFFDTQNKKSEQKRTHLCTQENCYSNWSITISQMLNTFFLCVSQWSEENQMTHRRAENWDLYRLHLPSLQEMFFVVSMYYYEGNNQWCFAWCKKSLYSSLICICIKRINNPQYTFALITPDWRKTWSIQTCRKVLWPYSCSSLK